MSGVPETYIETGETISLYCLYIIFASYYDEDKETIIMAQVLVNIRYG
jgi:hypothetical protein